jgi:SAM-dependent methyltransferase
MMMMMMMVTVVMVVIGVVNGAPFADHPHGHRGRNLTKMERHYDKSYLSKLATNLRQNRFLFEKFIDGKGIETLADFGGARGAMLDQFPEVKRRILIEINDAARAEANPAFEKYQYPDQAPRCVADVIMSAHCLEHTECPICILRQLMEVLKPGGRIVIVVPNDKVGRPFDPTNTDKHLYTWNAMLLGNLADGAEYENIVVDEIQHVWFRPLNEEEMTNDAKLAEWHRQAHEAAVRDNNHQIRLTATRPLSRPCH